MSSFGNQAKPGKGSPLEQIRATHRYAFRSGEWATILTIAPTPVLPRDGDVTLRECYLVRFADGQEDFFAVNDPDAGYEFRGGDRA